MVNQIQILEENMSARVYEMLEQLKDGDLEGISENCVIYLSDYDTRSELLKYEAENAKSEASQ